MQITAYADASFDEKNNVAGIGILIKKGEKERIYSFWTRAHSNNEAELFAVYMAGILTEQKGVIYTDSQTALDYVAGSIKDKPRTKEQFIRHKHCELVAYKIRKLGLTLGKIKGHRHVYQSHAMGNNLADMLAKAGRAKFYEK